jgi:hypothetical protein
MECRGGRVARQACVRGVRVPGPPVHIWDVRQAVERLRLQAGQGQGEPTYRTEFPFLVLSVDGKWVAWSNPDSRILGVYEVATGKRRHEGISPDRGTCALAFSPEAKLLAAHSYSGDRIDL